MLFVHIYIYRAADSIELDINKIEYVFIELVDPLSGIDLLRVY